MIRYFIRLASLLIGMLTLSVFALFAQKEDYTWVFGRNHRLDFNYDPPRLDSLPLENSERTAVISDKDGKLRFYLDGTLTYSRTNPPKGIPFAKIRDAEGRVIENGDSLATHYSIYQNLLLPLPGMTEQYILFHLWNDYSEFSQPHGLYYSLIDGQQNKVTKKNILIADSLFSQKMTAVRHANGTDWWILFTDYNGGKIYRILLSQAGIAPLEFQTIGKPWETQEQKRRNTVSSFFFSEDGQLLINNVSTGSELYRFNRCDGLLTPIEVQDGIFILALSPDGKIFYALKQERDGDTHYNIYPLQYELDEEAHRFRLIGPVGQYKVGNHNVFTSMKLTPTGKMIIGNAGELYLRIINFPNEKELMAGYQDSAIKLGNNMRTQFFYGLFPNIPNYRLGAISCSTNARPKDTKKYFMELYPNPATESITLRYRTEQAFNVILSDVTGRKVAETNLNASGEYTFDVTELPAGIYIVRAWSEDRILFTEKVVVVR